VKKTSPQKMQV